MFGVFMLGGIEVFVTIKIQFTKRIELKLR